MTFVSAFPHLKSLPKAIRFLTKKAYSAALGDSCQKVSEIRGARATHDAVRRICLSVNCRSADVEARRVSPSSEATSGRPELFEQTLDLLMEGDDIQLRVLGP